MRQLGLCLLTMAWAASSTGVSALSFSLRGMVEYVSDLYCDYAECCSERDVWMDVDALRRAAKRELFGQPLVEEAFHAFADYWRNAERSAKPLTLSLHGWPGVGKTFFSGMLVEAFYRRGADSAFVKRYSGAASFPRPDLVDVYRERLRAEVEATVVRCAHSLFVFEEVNDVPPGVLSALRPALDYRGAHRGVDYSKAIFVFISNVGGDEIVAEFLALKKPREEMTFADFDYVLRNASYGGGGFRDSPVIDRHLIDHFVPFLPLEENHVRLCAEREFRKWDVYSPTDAMISEALSVLTFGPPHLPIFSNSGCKRIEKKVAYIVQKSRREL